MSDLSEIEVMIPALELTAINEAAKASGVSVESFVVTAATREALGVIWRASLRLSQIG